MSTTCGPLSSPAGIAALTTTDLSCGYSGVPQPVLHGLDLSVAEGRLVCVIGSNGVGKSTLARTLAGLLPPQAGEIALQGRILSEFTPAERARRISVVLTRLPTTGYMTVRNFVEIGRHPYTGTLGRMTQTDHQAVDRAIAQVGIGGLAGRWMNAISDGERQRAAVARAFAQAATLMILDEPTAFLDVESRAVVMTTLRDLAHETGKSVVATSHDIELVLRIADEVWMIAPDKSVMTGAPEDLVLIGAMNKVFPQHVMRFDLETGGFRLPHPTGSDIVVAGSGPSAVWTARALERIGMRVRSVAANSGSRDQPTPELPVVTPAAQDGLWTLNSVRDGASRRFDSIADLVEHLRSHRDGTDDG